MLFTYNLDPQLSEPLHTNFAVPSFSWRKGNGKYDGAAKEPHVFRSIRRTRCIATFLDGTLSYFYGK